MINIAVVDDNETIRGHIISLINQVLFSNPIEYSVHPYESSERLLNELNIINFNIAFLDIELNGISGIDLAHVISKEKKECIIIFLTAYAHYMKDAFGINVYRYILKNECDKLLPIVLNEVIHLCENKEKRVFNIPKGITSIFLDTIVYVEFLERNPFLILNNNRTIKLSAASLKSVKKHINSQEFVQINNHIIVNMRYIKEISNNEVLLDSVDKRFVISRGKFKETVKTYQRFILKG